MNKEIKIVPPEGYDIDKENSTFECIKFKPIKKELPKTWEEFCETYPRKAGEAYFRQDCTVRVINGSAGMSRVPEYDKNLLPSKKYAEAMLALCQLIQLRDCYNDGWEPSLCDCITKYYIYTYKNEINTGYTLYGNRILSFKSRELRDQFFENFQDLIETAKPLL